MSDLSVRKQARQNRRRRRLDCWEKPQMIRLPAFLPPELHPSGISHNWNRYRRGHSAYLPPNIAFGIKA